MIDGINDTDADADALAELLRGEHAHVNLIPMNPVAHTPWTGTPMPRGRAVRGPPARGGHHDDDPASTAGMEIGAACGQLAAEHAGQPAPIVVQRRRERLVDESARALRGERSDEPVPGRGGGGLTVSGCHPVGQPPAPAGVLIAASILDCGPGRPRATRSGGPRTRARTGSTSTSWTATSSPTSPSAGRRSTAVRRSRAAVRRPPDDRGAGPLDRAVPRRRLRLDHVPRRGRRAADPARRSSGSARPAARPGCRSSPGRRSRRSTPTASCSTSCSS